MFRTNAQRWLAIASSVSSELGWDNSLLLMMEPDERTFAMQVRKSPLVFTARQDMLDLETYTVSYSLYKPDAPPDTTARRITAGEFQPPAFVAAELEKWLRDSVARFARDRQSMD